MDSIKGQRLRGKDGGVYLIGDCRESTPWYRVYAARKLFVNYRPIQREYYEAVEDEWIEVLVRVGPQTADLSKIEHWQNRLRYEMTEVLAKQTAWFPEPVDWLEPLSGEIGQPETTANDLRPMLITSSGHGQTLREWRSGKSLGPSRPLRVAAELLNLLESLHQGGQIIGGMSPDDFLIDEAGRLCCLCANRVFPKSESAELRPLLPPQRFPEGFAAPEAFDVTSALDVRSDLFSWAALTLFLIVDFDPTQTAAKSSEPGKTLCHIDRSQIETALASAAQHDPNALYGLSPNVRRQPLDKLARVWSEVLILCLSEKAKDRPASIRALRRHAVSRTGLRSLARLWNWKR